MLTLTRNLFRFLVHILIVLPVLLAAAAPATAGEMRPYAHPDVDMEFRDLAGWQPVERPGDPGTSEWAQPGTGIRALMWMTSTEMNAERYLRKMSGMMDLDVDAEPVLRTIDGRDGWVLEIPGRISGEPVRTVLAVVASGRSAERPKENLLYVFQFHCPAADSTRLAPVLRSLLNGCRVTDRVIIDGRLYRLYPESLDNPGDLPSPCTAAGRQYLTARTREGRWALVDCTVENGAPNDYGTGQWGRGEQLAIDAADFPTLAATGLHDPDELAATKTITGRPVADIVADARPGCASRSGFLSVEEDLLEVIARDNETVRALGLTHPQLAEPLFRIFNVVLRDMHLYRRGAVPHHHIVTLRYGPHEIHLETSGGKGWQESIFADEVQGYWQIRVHREPTHREQQFLEGRFAHLSHEHVDEITSRLLDIRTGEMVPFYIQKYGFYEGATEYRADPVAIAVLFGLVQIAEMDEEALLEF